MALLYTRHITNLFYMMSQLLLDHFSHVVGLTTSTINVWLVDMSVVVHMTYDKSILHDVPAPSRTFFTFGWTNYLNHWWVASRLWCYYTHDLWQIYFAWCQTHLPNLQWRCLKPGGFRCGPWVLNTSSNDKPAILQDVLHVPHISTNLLSVYRNTKQVMVSTNLR